MIEDNRKETIEELRKDNTLDEERNTTHEFLWKIRRFFQQVDCNTRRAG